MRIFWFDFGLDDKKFLLDSSSTELILPASFLHNLVEAISPGAVFIKILLEDVLGLFANG